MGLGEAFADCNPFHRDCNRTGALSLLDPRVGQVTIINLGNYSPTPMEREVEEEREKTRGQGM